MSRRVAIGMLLALCAAPPAVVVDGCASSHVRVTRTPWVKSTPQRPPSADTTQAELQRPAITTQVTHSAPPAAPPTTSDAIRVETVTRMRDREPPLIDSSVTSVATDVPGDAAGADSFDAAFSGAGTVQEVGQDEIMRSWPADADSTGPSPSVPARVPADTTPPAAADSAAGKTEYAALQAPPLRHADAQGADAYVVQLFAFPTRAAADFAARQAAKALHANVWVEDLQSAAVPFKVYAGHFTTRPPADELRGRAQENGFPEAFVVTRPAGR